MKSSKKLTSFVCSLALATSMFSGIIVADAVDSSEVTQGIVFEYDKDGSSSTQAKIKVYATGFDSLATYQVNVVSATEGVVISSASYENNKAGEGQFTITDSVNSEHVYKILGNINAEEEPSMVEDSLLGTITLNFDTALTTDAVITLTEGSMMTGTKDGETVKLTASMETLPMTEVTISANPDATDPPTQPPTQEPTAAPIETAKPGYMPTEEPVATTPVFEPVEQGITFKVVNTTANTADIEVSATGFDSLATYQVNVVSETDGINIASATYENNKAGEGQFTITDSVNAEHVYKILGNINAEEEPSMVEDSVLGTIKLTFDNNITDYVIISLTEGSMMTGTKDGETVKITEGTGTLTLSKIAVEAPDSGEPEEPTPFPTEETEKKASEIATNASDYPSEYDGKQLNGLTVTATTTSGDATYGEDYVAYYDGEELTEAEFSNLINGYDGVTVADMISNLSFRANKGVSISIAPAYMDDTTKTTLPGYEKTYENELPDDKKGNR